MSPMSARVVTPRWSRPVIIVLLLLALWNTGCATIMAAAISGGDRDAIAAGAAVDTVVLGVASAAARERERPPQQPPPMVQRQVVVVHVHNHFPGSGEIQANDGTGQVEQRHAAASTSSIPRERSRDQVRAVLLTGMPELRRCQDEVPMTDGGAYRAYCRFRVGPDGVPVGVELRVHEPKPLRDCVEEVIGQWRFPEAEMTTAVSLPLVWPIQPLGT